MRDSLLNQGISDKEVEKNRIKVIRALQDPNNEQCYRLFHRGDMNCFLGLIHKTLIGPISGKPRRNRFKKLIEMIDITDEELWYYVGRNDSYSSFTEIANLLILRYNFPNVPLQDSSNEVGQQPHA